MTPAPQSTPRPWLPLILLALGALFLIAKGTTDSMANFAPAMAFAFTGALVMPVRYRIWAPLALVFLTDVILMFVTGYGIGFLLNGIVAVKYLALIAAAFWGSRLQHVSILGTLGRVLTCGIAFYFLTNTFAWLTSPAYPLNLAGWIQANWTGTPGFPPSWMFLRNSLLSDQVFSLVLLLAFNLESSLRQLPTLQWLPAPRFSAS